MSYARPSVLNDALTLLSQGDWTVLSGGTDFYPALGEAQVTGKVLDISALQALNRIETDAHGIRIGALVTWSDLIAADLPAAFDGLKLSAREIGSVQIQNHATLVGNLCNASPAADGVPPLLSLSAELELESVSGSRQLPLQDFILGNRKTARRDNELVTAIRIPGHAMLGHSAFLKLGSRKYLVISIAMVAGRLHCNEQQQIQTAALSVGACSLVAQRLPELEQALVGQPVNSDLAALVAPRHLQSLAPIDDVRASASYRLAASEQLLRRALNLMGSEHS